MADELDGCDQCVGAETWLYDISVCICTIVNRTHGRMLDISFTVLDCVARMLSDMLASAKGRLMC